MKDEWEALVMKVSVKPIDFNVLVDRLWGEAQDFEAFTIGWSGRIDRVDPDMFIHSILHSDNAQPGGNNLTGYSVPEYDELADAQRVEMDQEKRCEIVFEAQEILAVAGYTWDSDGRLRMPKDMEVE